MPSPQYLCFYHDNDLDARGVSFPSYEHEPAIYCQACRFESVRLHKIGQPGYFSLQDILEFEKENPQQLQTIPPPAADVLGRLHAKR